MYYSILQHTIVNCSITQYTIVFHSITQYTILNILYPLLHKNQVQKASPYCPLPPSIVKHSQALLWWDSSVGPAVLAYLGQSEERPGLPGGSETTTLSDQHRSPCAPAVWWAYLFTSSSLARSLNPSIHPPTHPSTHPLASYSISWWPCLPRPLVWGYQGPWYEATHPPIHPSIHPSIRQ